MHLLLTTLAVVGLGLNSLRAVGQESNQTALKTNESSNGERDSTGARPVSQISDTRDKLQAVLCETRSPDPNVVGLAIRNKLPQIGGWFSIHTLLLASDEDAAFQRNLKKHRGDADLSFELPSETVLRVLPRVLPQADIPKSPYGNSDRAKLIQDWKEWVSVHESALKELQPTGDGVDFSDGACKNGKPVRKMSSKNKT